MDLKQVKSAQHLQYLQWLLQREEWWWHFDDDLMTRWQSSLQHCSNIAWQHAAASCSHNNHCRYLQQANIELSLWLWILSLPNLWVIFQEYIWNKQYLLFRYKVKIQNVKMWQVSIINLVVSWYSCNENINYPTVSLIIILTVYCSKTD